jgi:RHS repeat-associated protein
MSLTATLLDYANNRYYSNAYGRFMTPDPSASSQDPSTPQSWNRYPYVPGDPVNKNDPTGLDGDGCDPSEDPTCGCDPSDPSCGGGTSPPPPPAPGVPSTITLGCAVPTALSQLAAELYAQSDICETQINTTNGSSVTNYSLIVPASVWSQLAGASNGFLPGLAAAGAGGGLIVLDGTDIWVGIVASVTAPEVLITIGAIAGAVALYNYVEQLPPCVPPAGTMCYEPNSGHTHNGWDPHYHVWQQNQNPATGKCFWSKTHGTRGTTPAPPAGMLDCNTYPSWPTN